MKDVPHNKILEIPERIGIPKEVKSDFMYQDPNAIDLLFWEFEQHTGINLEGEKVLDLGSGHGMVLAVGEHLGIQMYGVEKDERRYLFSKNRLKKAGYHPQVKNIDYFSPEIASLRFNNGTRISEINYFYIFPYTGMIYASEGGHRAKVIRDFFQKDFVSKNSYLMITGVSEKLEDCIIRK